MKTKNDIRKIMQSLFSKQDRENLGWKDTNIMKQVLEYIEKSNVQYICIYESLPDEVNTQQIILELEKVGKSIYTPQVVSETEMILIDDEYGPYEKEIDLFIIPGRAFSLSWNRLGRWKWYYDRFLANKQYKHSKKIGICYDFQVLSDIPTNNHDIAMNTIIHN